MENSQVVLNAARLGEKWAGIPGIERTPAGRLYVVCFSGGDKEPKPENTVYMSRREGDDGPFSDPIRMAEPRDGARAFDPCLWLDPKGRLWLLFNRGDKAAGAHGVFARVCADPDADEPMWGDEFRLGYDAPFSFRLNKPTVLSTGEWLMPVTHASRPTYEWFARPHQLQGVGVSSDQGRSWTLRGAVEAPTWALENMILERGDGSLVMYIRTGDGVLWQSVSSDRGVTWSPGEPTVIVNPGSRFFMRAMPDGDWLLINSPNPKKRRGLVASLSSDEGATWRGWLALDERGGVSYPDAAFDADGTIYAVYDRDRKGAGEILLSEFHKDAVSASEIQCGSKATAR